MLAGARVAFDELSAISSRRGFSDGASVGFRVCLVAAVGSFDVFTLGDREGAFVGFEVIGLSLGSAVERDGS